MTDQPKPGSAERALDALRQILRGGETLIGALLGLILAVFALGVCVVAPLHLVYEYLREGEVVRAALLGTLVGSYVTIALRAFRRRELGPAEGFAGLAVLAVVGWVAWRALR